MIMEIIPLALGGMFTTIALLIKYLDRRAKERAILAAKSDQQREDIASIPPLSLIFILTLASGLLCCAAAVGIQIRAAALAKAQTQLCAKDCKTDDDCRPPSVCRRGACVNTAAEARPTIAMYLPNRNHTTAWSPINGR